MEAGEASDRQVPHATGREETYLVDPATGLTQRGAGHGVGGRPARKWSGEEMESMDQTAGDGSPLYSLE